MSVAFMFSGPHSHYGDLVSKHAKDTLDIPTISNCDPKCESSLEAGQVGWLSVNTHFTVSMAGSL